MESGEFTSAGASAPRIPAIDAETLSSVVEAILGSRAVRDHLDRSETDFDADAFKSLLRQLILDSLAAVMQDRSRAAEIRTFFDGGQAMYSLAELSALWRIPLSDVCEIFNDQLNAGCSSSASAASFSVQWIDAVSTATIFNLFRAIEVERALGADLERIRSGAYRTTAVLVHLPQFIIETMQRIATVPSSASLAALTEQFIADACEVDWVLRAVSAACRSGDTP
jgi:hypothetical protein